ncbi:MAG: hypothetical protein K1X75_09475 [Leptospirales bacterium]|nr:hypothetical protein [Leptospirales bacterium]
MKLRIVCLSMLVALAPAHCLDLQRSQLDTSGDELLSWAGLLLRPYSVDMVAPTMDGKVFVSRDGYNWSLYIVNPAANQLNAAVFTGAGWIVAGAALATGQCGIFASSLGESTWTLVGPALGSCSGGNINGLASNGSGRVVAVGADGGGTTAIYYSSDYGASWTQGSSSLAVGALSRAAFAAGTFLTGPTGGTISVLSSADGVSFTPLAQPFGAGAGQLTSFNISGVGIYAGGIAPDTLPEVRRSADGGVTWSAPAADVFGNSGAAPPAGLAVNNFFFPSALVAVGAACLVDRSTNPIAIQFSGAATAMTGCVTTNWNGLVYDGLKFVASGNNPPLSGSIAVSPSGAVSDWSIISLGSTLPTTIAHR